MKNKGKLQSAPLKFGIAWILPLEVGKIGFYTLKFPYISKSSPSVSDTLMWQLSDTLVFDV